MQPSAIRLTFNPEDPNRVYSIVYSFADSWPPRYDQPAGEGRACQGWERQST